LASNELLITCFELERMDKEAALEHCYAISLKYFYVY
jgi:hypothetical protein